MPVSKLDKLLDRLGFIADELGQLHGELATLLAAEAEGKVQAWATSQDTTIQGRDRQASAVVLPLTQDIFRLKASIRVLEEERDHKRLLVYVEMTSSDGPGPSASNHQRLLAGYPAPPDATGGRD